MRRPNRRDLLALLRGLREPTRLSAGRAVLDGAVVTMTLRRQGIRGLLPTDDIDPSRADEEQARSISAAVDAGLGVLPAVPSCLRRSVTLLRELHRLDLQSALHVGVRQGPRGIEAHAWVQVGDAVVNDDPAVTASYVQLAAGDVERIARTLR